MSDAAFLPDDRGSTAFGSADTVLPTQFSGISTSTLHQGVTVLAARALAQTYECTDDICMPWPCGDDNDICAPFPDTNNGTAYVYTCGDICAPFPEEVCGDICAPFPGEEPPPSLPPPAVPIHTSVGGAGEHASAVGDEVVHRNVAIGVSCGVAGIVGLLLMAKMLKLKASAPPKITRTETAEAI